MTVWEDTIVRLEPWELLLASHQAGIRWATVEAKGWGDHDRGGQLGNSVDQHVSGVCGEIAVAKWTGRYWTAGRRAAGDVGGLEVRTFRCDAREERGHLLIQPYDERNRPDTPFVLVVGQGREYRLVGWVTPREARRLAQLGGASETDFGGRGAKCLAIPQAALKPVDEFRVDEIPGRPITDYADVKEPMA